MEERAARRRRWRRWRAPALSLSARTNGTIHAYAKYKIGSAGNEYCAGPRGLWMAEGGPTPSRLNPGPKPEPLSESAGRRRAGAPRLR